MSRGNRSPGGSGREGFCLLAAAFLLLASCSSFFQTSVPQREGTLTVPGLSAPVEIVRDAYGIPHITAANDHDLYFAQGFVHAQDRLFQMDTERRLTRGELAEIYGEPALPADRLFRHLGFAVRAPGIVASLPERSREIMQAYCEGVNAAMDSLRAWPVEFRLLGTAPRKFTPEDVVAIGLLKSFGLAQWGEEAVLSRAWRTLPRAKAEELMPRVPPGSPVVAPRFSVSSSSGFSPSVLTEGLASLRRTVGDLPRGGGSNAWAVSGRKSATGSPILANDPHILLPCPSLWYEIHLVAPGVDVYGVSFPGAPCVVIGHTPDIAWGFTNAMLDDADFFVERVNGDRVMFRKKWIPMTKRIEKIRVRGKREETLSVWETPHGPILSPVLSGAFGALSLRWVGFDGGDALGALHDLNRARNREEFTAAVAKFPHPAQNIVYADRGGNIGVVTAGRIPVRRGGSGLLPVPGDTGEWEWTGTVPFSENPKVWNPPDGFVAAANFPPAGTAYPHYLSRLYEPPDRGRRILRMLEEEEKFSVEKFERMQRDVFRADAAGAVSLAVRVARQRERESQDFGDAAKILSRWDLHASAESSGATLYEVFYEKMIENAFLDDLGEDLFEEATRTSRLLWNAMDRMIERGDSLFLENKETGVRESIDDLAARSLLDAMAFLKHRLGKVSSTWRWDRLHQVTFEHPFGKRRYLRRWFNIGPHPVPGDGRTVFKQEFRHGTDFSVLVGPSFRQIVPLGFRSMTRAVIATGQSGHFFERHYRDQSSLWLSGESRPAWTDPRDIRENTESVLRLTPKARGRS
ncbi:MAG TPA: penicillin acylase family protein [Candidatus Deferrimicrobiaceae bacterium]|nr:penicillin acylase family protein [Candidatus Deferrimicrobiaceae bacterium]